jgi:hypothetical protein
VFVYINLFSLLVFILGLVLYCRNVNAFADASKRKRKQLSSDVVKAVRDADDFMKAKDGVSFLASCKRALQLHIADQLGIAADSVTISDFHKINGFSNSKVDELFDLADAVKYSGYKLSFAEMEEWKGILDSELKELGGTKNG